MTEYDPWVGKNLEKEEMETIFLYYGILAWKIPWTEEPGGLQSMGSQRAGHDWTSEHGELNMLRALFAAQKNRCFHWNFKMIYIVENVRFWGSAVARTLTQNHGLGLFLGPLPFSLWLRETSPGSCYLICGARTHCMLPGSILLSVCSEKLCFAFNSRK